MTACTAPVKGHHSTQTRAECPSCGMSDRALPSSVQARPVPDRAVPAQSGEVVVEGLVARPTDAGDGFVLVYAETGQALFRRGRVRGSYGIHATKDDALEWARTSFPHLRNVARIGASRARAGAAAPRCGRCYSMMRRTDSGWACGTCTGVEIDRT